MSRDIVMAIIAATHSATGKIDPALRSALPEDRVLARLSGASLALALRAATPREVARRFSDITRQTSRGGPTLDDDIEGYGEAEAAARRMVADLQGWSDGLIAWSDVQRSVLLYGPPGTGKSSGARHGGQCGRRAGARQLRDMASAGQSEPHAARDAREL